MKRQGLKSRLRSHQKNPIIPLRVFEFQENPATGTMTNPEHISDSSSAHAVATVDETATVELPSVREISQFRHQGHAGNTNEDGIWVLQYRRFDSDSWHTVTQFSTRAATTWSDWISFTLKHVVTIRLYCYTADTGPATSSITELEIKG